MLSDEVAGGPEGEKKWVRSGVTKLTERLKERGFTISHDTVWMMLQRIGFLLLKMENR
jgi:hypothetical protein